ncbi:hypothetical protein NSMM_400094 [Nitrosomonas mobilis]|uniref:Uncharacterized protein n=1 Tax=Nitrosomonas mobilis TaxID=51642 RepID=A0A1G5SEI6_9PROT|nr:hypothetical protein NSMM_400094 [Nitrosomonas mobilis]
MVLLLSAVIFFSEYRVPPDNSVLFALGSLFRSLSPPLESIFGAITDSLLVVFFLTEAGVFGFVIFDGSYEKYDS